MTLPEVMARYRYSRNEELRAALSRQPHPWEGLQEGTRQALIKENLGLLIAMAEAKITDKIFTAWLTHAGRPSSVDLLNIANCRDMWRAMLLAAAKEE